MPSSSGKKPKSLLAVLKHPLRVTILDVVNDRPMSPSAFVESNYMPRELFNSYPQALSLASYHFRELEKVGLLRVLKAVPRRGAVEHVYEGIGQPILSETDFRAKPLTQRRMLSSTAFCGFAARTERAIRLGTFDARPDRRCTWGSLTLDPKGWEDLMGVLESASENAERVGEESAARIDGSADARIPVTFSIFGFESPNNDDPTGMG